ncbi:MAG TPA: pyridoxal-phosphate dependent enzyme, partial [Bacillota bacterium]
MGPQPELSPPTVADVWDARRVLHGVVRRTPVFQDDLLDAAVGATVHLKAEHLQRTGSFKVRGAYNKVRSLTPEARQRGILTISAGNAALGAAYAARAHGIACSVVMPARPVQAKLDAVRALGAEVVLHGTSTPEMFAKADELIAEHGFTLVHPFEQPEVIAGQGTIGLEI